MRFSRERFAKDWGGNWSFGKWALTSQMTGLAFYLLPWILAAVHGEAETGELAACSTLVGLSNLFVIGLNNFLMPKAAQAFSQRGPHALCSVLRKAMLWSVAVLGGLCLVACFAGNCLAGSVYGPNMATRDRLIFMLALATFTDAHGAYGQHGPVGHGPPLDQSHRRHGATRWSPSAPPCGWCFPWARWALPSPWWPAEPPAPRFAG